MYPCAAPLEWISEHREQSTTRWNETGFLSSSDSVCIFVRDNSLLSFEVSHLLGKDDDSMLLLWGEFCKKRF